MFHYIKKENFPSLKHFSIDELEPQPVKKKSDTLFFRGSQRIHENNLIKFLRDEFVHLESLDIGRLIWTETSIRDLPNLRSLTISVQEDDGLIGRFVKTNVEGQGRMLQTLTVSFKEYNGPITDYLLTLRKLLEIYKVSLLKKLKVIHSDIHGIYLRQDLSIYEYTFDT